jgi:hypothetical protein
METDPRHAGNNDSIALERDVIRYHSRRFGDWELSISQVKVIGEMTNASGPGADDYFICFATDTDMAELYEASFYADGCEEFLDTLSRALGAPLRLGLAHSTEGASRVLWPPSLAGEPMFEWLPIAPGTFYGFVMNLCGRQERSFTEAVRRVLMSGASSAEQPQ